MDFHAAGGDSDVRERLLIAGNQLGKALKNDTGVLTPSGWVRIADLNIGDSVIAGDGSVTTVTGVYPQGIKPLHKLTFDYGEEVICCGEHLWKFQHPASRFKTRQDRNGIVANKRYGEWMVADTNAILDIAGPNPTPRRRVVMPYAGVVDFPQVEVSIDPYLLGALLGDGCLTKSVSFSTADQDVLDGITAALPEGVYIKHYSKYDYGLTVAGGKGHGTGGKGAGNPLINYLKEIGLMGTHSANKFVPKLYLYNSPDVRLALLQGLLDTDGSISADGAIEFTTISKQLRDDVMFLVWSFGGKCKYTVRYNSFTYKAQKKTGVQSYRIRIRLPHVTPFRMKRKCNRLIKPVSTSDYRVLHKIEPAGEENCTCISVAHEDKTFIIDHFIVTHNTWSAGFETAMHLTGRYPDWWEGAVFDSPIAAWAAGVTSEVTRDAVQRVLCGRFTSIGTGAIPKDAIVEKSMKRGVADAIDTLVIRWGGGGDIQAKLSTLGFKSYDQGREKFQAETLDIVWFDEEPPADIYTEGLTRTNATDGIVYTTFTPLKGMSEVVKRFLLDKPEGTHVTTMTIDDALHYTPEKRAAIIASYPAHEREARAKGIPTLGSGKVFPVEENSIKEMSISIPNHWPRLVGMDFGWDHPTAIVWGAWDRDTDTVHIYDCLRAKETTPVMHSASIKAKGAWIPVAWPHDGLQHDKGSGEALADIYRKLGVNMLKDKATHAPAKGEEEGTGGNSVEAGLMEMLDRMHTGRLKVADHLNDWFEEFRLYHRKDGKLVKLDDDLMSATRYLIMMLRHAKVNTPKRTAPSAGFRALDNEIGY